MMKGDIGLDYGLDSMNVHHVLYVLGAEPDGNASVYLDPEGWLITMGFGGDIGMAQGSTPPAQLHGAWMEFTRPPLGKHVEFVNLSGYWTLRDAVGPCGRVTHLGVELDWRKKIDLSGEVRIDRKSLSLSGHSLEAIGRAAGMANDAIEFLWSTEDGALVSFYNDCYMWVSTGKHEDISYEGLPEFTFRQPPMVPRVMGINTPLHAPGIRKRTRPVKT